MLQARLSTFLYHEVTDLPQSSGMQGRGTVKYKHPVREFEDNLDQIASAGMKPALVEQIDLDAPGRHLLITFDDGGLSSMASADALERRGWRGHYFITTALLGQPGFLSAAQLRELHGRGHHIGSHSHSHPDIFYRLSRQDMLKEWRMSMAILDDIIGAPVISASIPGGDGSAEVYGSAGACGILFLFTSEPWIKPRLLGGTICIGRVFPVRGTDLATVRGYAQFAGYRRAQVVRTTKTLGKRMLGPVYPMLASRG
jgi:peptidoglycan/xylan/chitin deacetylase (PgdA/CDA1 family)